MVNRASVPFRNAASTLLRSDSYLGAQYRRLLTRLGAPKGITAMARQMALTRVRLDALVSGCGFRTAAARVFLSAQA